MHDLGLRAQKRPPGNVFLATADEHLPPEIQSEVKWSRLYTAFIRRVNVTFLWRIKVYDSGPGQLSTSTALACAEKAKRLWVRVSWQDRKGYAPYSAPGDTASRNGPSTPSRSCWTRRFRPPITHWTIPRSAT